MSQAALNKFKVVAEHINH